MKVVVQKQVITCSAFKFLILAFYLTSHKLSFCLVEARTQSCSDVWVREVAEELVHSRYATVYCSRKDAEQWPRLLIFTFGRVIRAGSSYTNPRQ